MGLSVSEKKELRAIIANRITMRSRALETENQALLTGLDARAHVSALTELGIRDEMGQLDALNAQKTALERDIEAAEALIYDRIRHVEHVLYNSRPERIKQIIGRAQKPIEEALIAATSLGQQIAQLNTEKGRLEETVWAATSPRQVSDIFQALNRLLDERPTTLEQAAHDLQHPDD